MSATATAIVSSAEGAGDMPSSVPAAGGNSSQDGDQPFSEVLSLSSPDHPDSSSSAPPAGPPPDDAADDTDRAVTTGPGLPAAHRAGSVKDRAQRKPGPSERGDGKARSGAASAPFSSARTSDETSNPVTAPTQAEGVAVDVDQNPGVAPPPAALATPPTPATSTAPGLPVPSPTAVASATSEHAAGATASSDVPVGPHVPTTTLAPAQDASVVSAVASSAAQPPPTRSAGSTAEGVGRNPAPADVTAGEHGETRGAAARAAVPGSAAFLSGPVRIQVSGVSQGAAATTVSAATMGTSGTAAVSAEEVLELAGLPDGAGGTAGVDVSDLAASISRPLAAGNGDYSVQVSLHPPELGEVRALLSLQGDVLHVTLTPEHATGFDALSAALPALHEQLAGGGVEVHVSLGQPGDPEGGDGRGTAEAGPGEKAPSDDATPAVSLSTVPLRSGGPGRIHLVL